MLVELDTKTLFYTSIIVISLIYTCGIFFIVNFIRFIRFSVHIHGNQPFFQIRQPKSTILYISLFVFASYILNPLTLILLNIHDTKEKQIALYIQDITTTLIFISFFIRNWILWFDLYFIDTLTNWIWRREVNPMESETNVLVKYTKFIQANRHLLIILFHILFITPLFITLLILSNSNIIQINRFVFNNIIDIFRVIYLIIFTILLAVTFYVSYNKTYIATDQYYIRSELIHSIISAGFMYTISLIVSSVTFVDSELQILLNVTLTHIGMLCVIYYTAYWTQKQFKFMNLFNSNASPFFNIFSKKQTSKFQDLMNNKHAINAFAHQLVNEWGLESMIFIIEVSQFKAIIKKSYPSYAHESDDDSKQNNQLCTDNTLFSVSNILNVNWMPINNRMKIHSPHKIALYLYDKYIDSAADLCINISSTNRRFIYKTFKQIADELHDEELIKEFQPDILGTLYTLFDEALKEIWHLIKTDPFFRFKQSEKFKRLLFVVYPTQAKKAFQEFIKTKLKKKIKLKPQVQLNSTSVFEEEEQEQQEQQQHETPESPLEVTIFETVVTKPIVIKNINNAYAMTGNHNNEEKYQSHDIMYQHRARASSLPVEPQKSFEMHLTPIKHDAEENTAAELWVKTDRQKSSDYLTQFSDISDDIIVPSEILQTCHSFWRSNINNLSESNKLEIGMTVYMALISEDKSILRAINRNRIVQTQIHALSTQFLHMINWLTVSLWNRDNHNLHESFSKIGTLHKNMNIETKHFESLLTVLHETLSHYFPEKYTLREQLAFDYIFAYSVEILMKKPLSFKTIHKSYYKELESKFNKIKTVQLN